MTESDTSNPAFRRPVPNGETDVAARAIVDDLKAMDKFRRSLSSDIVAHCRVLNRVLDDDERHISGPLKSELLEWIINRIVHFGGFDILKHSVISRTVWELADSNRELVVGLIGRFETEKKQVKKIA